jgi:hypothetical protein
MTSVFGYARTHFIGGRYWPEPLPTFDGEIARFQEMLADLPPENFIVAKVDPARLGPDQAMPVSPDAEWPEAPPGWSSKR